MSWIWIPLALAAVSFQTARNALARSIAPRVSAALASWSRFAFNLPWALLLVAGLAARHGLPEVSARFFVLCAGTAATQLGANVALIAAFQRGNFAQAITFHRLDVLFGAIVGVAFFAENPSALGWAGMALSSVGVMLASRGRAGAAAGWRGLVPGDASSLLAILAALLLVLASFWLKEATQVFAAVNPRVGAARFEAAGWTLFHVTWIEVAALSAVLLARRPAEFRAVPALAGRMAAIGACGFAGSLAWFWAFAVGLVAYVRAIGQLEAVVAVLFSLRVFGEGDVRGQLPGIALVVAGLVLVLLGA